MRLVFYWMTTWIFPVVIFAHGVEGFTVSEELRERVETVRFVYSTGEPMMYAKIRLYPPSQPETEILQSITDMNGFYSFIPDKDGEWCIAAEDGMGHKSEIQVLIRDQKSTNTTANNTVQTGKKLPLVILGLSLILNIFLLWHFAAMKKKRVTQS